MSREFERLHDQFDEKKDPFFHDDDEVDMNGTTGLLTVDEAVKYLGGLYSKYSLNNFRCTKDPSGPRYMKFGNKIRYRRSDLDEFINSKLVEPNGYRKRMR